MGKITFELIRKKTEHHDGLLEDLEEISLHQLNIDKIETIGRICPKLKILYLQNNIIGKIENIKRLKSMIYLNLALNNITSIPMEISHCEKLRKFDLTVNFIDVDALESSIDALATLIHLDELYLTGNPCTQVPNYRLYVVHRLPKLEKLDGTEVTRGERIQAKQQFDEIEKKVRQLAADKRKEKGITEEAAAASSSSSKDDDDLEEEKEMSFEAKSQKVSAYTPELRLQMHKEQEEFERKKEEDKKKSQKGEQPEDLWKEAQKKMNEKVTATDGDELPKQRNMAKWDFTIDEKSDVITVDVAVPRFLDTSLIDIDVHPFWFQVIAKGKNLLLHFPAEVQSNVCKIQRLQINGHLVLTAPKVKKVNTTTHSTSKINDKSSSSSAPTEDDDLDADEDMDAARANLAKVKAMESNVASTHQNVVDLSVGKAQSASASSSSTSSSNAFQRHQGNSLNQVTTDYRHITKKKETTGGAHMREIQATRSATLEEARQERMRAEAQSKHDQTDEQVKAELERLGLDDSGVPDLE